MVYFSMKRPREGKVDNSLTAMANCLVFLSRGDFNTNNNISPSRVFECTTCNRQFQSFQALGGHRASHKKPRLATGGDTSQLDSEPAKPKTHECSICGIQFAIGQALGGHMRRHRAGGLGESQAALSLSSTTQVPVGKKEDEKTILCLDLNLTPYENDLEFRIGKVAPIIDFYL